MKLAATMLAMAAVCLGGATAALNLDYSSPVLALSNNKLVVADNRQASSWREIATCASTVDVAVYSDGMWVAQAGAIWQLTLDAAGGIGTGCGTSWYTAVSGEVISAVRATEATVDNSTVYFLDTGNNEVKMVDAAGGSSTTVLSLAGSNMAGVSLSGFGLTSTHLYATFQNASTSGLIRHALADPATTWVKAFSYSSSSTWTANAVSVDITDSLGYWLEDRGSSENAVQSFTLSDSPSVSAVVTGLPDSTIKRALAMDENAGFLWISIPDSNEVMAAPVDGGNRHTIDTPASINGMSFILTDTDMDYARLGQTVTDDDDDAGSTDDGGSGSPGSTDGASAALTAATATALSATFLALLSTRRH